MSKTKTRVESIGYAWEGIVSTIKNEPNFKIHLAMGTIALIASLFLKFTIGETIVLILTISLVLILELVNTALEAIVDLASPRKNPIAKIAKDVSAAAVLVSAFTAILVGVLLFLPKIY